MIERGALAAAASRGTSLRTVFGALCRCPVRSNGHQAGKAEPLWLDRADARHVNLSHQALAFYQTAGRIVRKKNSGGRPGSQCPIAVIALEHLLREVRQGHRPPMPSQHCCSDHTETVPAASDWLRPIRLDDRKRLPSVSNAANSNGKSPYFSGCHHTCQSAMVHGVHAHDPHRRNRQSTAPNTRPRGRDDPSWRPPRPLERQGHQPLRGGTS